ncbi:hypothetical protein phytr_8140 [Candidatus Phycorickettsia trachydisci]|uniref:Uncharacterized protein n=1 Tax=Candidatus Phycorickettsia trachydisci TaxID=2115978 RepID=A0A2P1P909_9RICK|nr:hypothetical protein [Candidatus Phycorickettsia trachydisci]AVP87747.1 hypothetical protein phytr_8140 [Candidatus Phycorickettsia trachydisci]
MKRTKKSTARKLGVKGLPTINAELGWYIQPLEKEFNELNDPDEKISLMHQIVDKILSHASSLLTPVIEYENSNILSSNPIKETLLEQNVKEVRDILTELYGTRAEDEIMDFLAVTELTYANQQSAKAFLCDQESFLKLINIYDKALTHSTQIKTAFKIIEAREKFIDTQVSIVSDPTNIHTFGIEKTKESIIELLSSLCDRYPEKIKNIFDQNNITKIDLESSYNQGNQHLKSFIDLLEDSQAIDYSNLAIPGPYLSKTDVTIIDNILNKDFEGRLLLKKMNELSEIPPEEFQTILQEIYSILRQKQKDNTNKIQTPNAKRAHNSCGLDEIDTTDRMPIKKAKLENPKKVSSCTLTSSEESINNWLKFEGVDWPEDGNAWLKDISAGFSDSDEHNIETKEQASIITTQEDKPDPFADVLGNSWLFYD